MIRTVFQRGLHAHDREPSDRTLAQHRAKALFHRWDVFAGHATADDRILKLEALGRVFGQRLQVADDVGILARTTGLLLVLVVIGRATGRGLTVAHLRRTHLDLDLVFPLDALDVDVEMQLAHAGDQRFAGFVVGGHAEGRILTSEPLQGLAELVEPLAIGRNDRHLDHGLGHEHVFQRAILRVGGVGVAGGRIDAHHRDDVAGFGGVDILPLVGMHPHDAAKPLLLARALVDVGLALLERALIEPHERELAVGIVNDLEGHRHERLRRIRLEVELLVGFRPVLRGHLPLERVGQIADDGVEQELDALILVGTATEHRRDALIVNGRLHDGVDLVVGGHLLREELFHQGIGIHRQGFEHRMPGLSRGCLVVGRDLFHPDGFAVVAVEVGGLHRDQVDHTLKLVFLADRDLQPDRVTAELVA